MEGKCELSHQVQFIKIIINEHDENNEKNFKCHVSIHQTKIFFFDTKAHINLDYVAALLKERTRRGWIKV